MDQLKRQRPKPRGKKPLDPNDETVFLTIRIPERVKDKLTSAGESLGLSNSDLMRAILKQWLEQCH